MTDKIWNEQGYMFGLTDEERRYFALEPIPEDGETRTFTRREDTLHTRVTVFFRGTTIVKVINESLAGADGRVWLRKYEEYDTQLETADGEILPLTARGKPKKLTASNINAVTPFGCRLRIEIRDKWTEVDLVNPRACKRFPIGCWQAVSAIRTEADFRGFAAQYIATCRADCFEKLAAFRSARKETVRYRPGDIFRMDYDRTRYCYGIITGELKQLRKMTRLPREHGFHRLMTVPIMVRLYQTVTEDPNLTAADLSGIPLDPVLICSDNDIIWGTHPIIGHRDLTPEDLYFRLSATLQTHYTGRFTREGCSMDIEWGFARVTLNWEALSDAVKASLDRFPLFSGGVSTAIDPIHASAGDSPYYGGDRDDLQMPENADLRRMVFDSLGLDTDTSFDAFAARFGGLTRQEILERMK